MIVPADRRNLEGAEDLLLGSRFVAFKATDGSRVLVKVTGSRSGIVLGTKVDRDGSIIQSIKRVDGVDNVTEFVYLFGPDAIVAEYRQSRRYATLVRVVEIEGGAR